MKNKAETVDNPKQSIMEEKQNGSKSTKIEEKAIRGKDAIKSNLKTEEKTKTSPKNNVKKENNGLDQKMSSVMENFKEYYKTAVNDETEINSDNADEDENSETEVEEKDELLEKLNDFMSEMKTKIEENKKKKQEAKKIKELKRKKIIEKERALNKNNDDQNSIQNDKILNGTLEEKKNI